MASLHDFFFNLLSELWNHSIASMLVSIDDIVVVYCAVSSDSPGDTGHQAKLA